MPPPLLRQMAQFDAETVIADFIGDILDGRYGRDTDYETGLRPLARMLLNELKDNGIKVEELA